MDNFHKGNIIYIEDDKLDQISFINFLDEYKLHYKCTIADSLKEAKKLLNHKHYDIALIDYKLSDGTAFDVIEKIEDTPFIILTGVGDEIVATQAMKRGAYDYIIKDLRGSYLKSLPMIIENTLKRRQIEEELKNYQDNLEKMVKERTEQLRIEIDEHEKDVENTMINNKELAENIKEMNCFNNLLNVTEDVDLELNEKLNKIVQILPNAFQEPGNTCIKLKYQDKECLSNNFKYSKNILKKDLIIKKEKVGQIEVCLLKEDTSFDEELFLESEILFLDTFSNYLINLIINLKKVECLDKENLEKRNKFNVFKDQIKSTNKEIKKISVLISKLYFNAKEYLEKIIDVVNANNGKSEKEELVYLNELKEDFNSLLINIHNLESSTDKIKEIIKYNKI
jgi:DNA-binding response OmpR family regulator